MSVSENALSYHAFSKRPVAFFHCTPQWFPILTISPEKAIHYICTSILLT